MAKIIVAFPNRTNAANIRNILVRGGYSVIGVCTTGAQVLQYAELLDEGILVCGYKLPDMLYTHLREYLPLEFEILLVASPDKWQEDIKGVVGLSAPLKVYDLMSTMEMMQQAMDRRRRIRKKEKRAKNPDQQKKIREAKELLMERNRMSEEEAHRYLQKCSMDSGTNLVETAEMVLSVMAE